MTFIDSFIALVNQDPRAAANHFAELVDSGEISFPNGTTLVHLMHDSYTRIDDPEEWEAVNLSYRLAIMADDALESVLRNNPELRDLDKFPLKPLKAILEELTKNIPDEFRSNLADEVVYIFMEHKNGYILASPH
jgi:hypothetical protein